jgi:hypothetical protein
MAGGMWPHFGGTQRRRGDAGLQLQNHGDIIEWSKRCSASIEGVVERRWHQLLWGVCLGDESIDTNGDPDAEPAPNLLPAGQPAGAGSI